MKNEERCEYYWEPLLDFKCGKKLLYFIAFIILKISVYFESIY